MIALRLLAMSATCIGASVSASAAPVEFDTESAHVIVIRPVDVWSADESRARETLAVVRAKKANYVAAVDQTRWLYASAQLFQRASDHPLIHATAAQLAAAGFEIASTEDYRFHVDPPLGLMPSEYAQFRVREEALFRAVVLAQGNPSQLRSRTSRGKFASGVVSLATLGLLGAAGGAHLAGAALHNGSIGDLYQMNQANVTAVPTRLPELDPTPFTTIDVRRIPFFGGMVGQIVIAYRQAKTPEAEMEALSKAIVTAAGADTTPEAIEAARIEDLSWRQAQWDACVADESCKTSAKP